MASNLKETDLETRRVSDAEAAFIVGAGGKTKAKLCTVSGARIDLLGKQSGGSHLEIRGTAAQRHRAKKYIDFLIAQRHGPVKIDDPSVHDDLTLLVVPSDAVSYVTGRAGASLRQVEEEWGALLFFLQVDPRNPPQHVDPNRMERLAIFGPARSRRGAELKVMAAVEAKQPSHFIKDLTPKECSDEGFGTDTLLIKEEDHTYVIGSRGMTRRKLARASNCIVEYVGRMAHFCGTKKERARAREYFKWLCQQRSGKQVQVDHEGRDDVTQIAVPSSCIGFVTGPKGMSLRSIEDETSTFCFTNHNGEETDEKCSLLIFGRSDDRQQAETLVWERISQKIDEADKGIMPERPRKGKSGKGKNGKGKDYYRDYYEYDYREKGEKGYGKKGRDGKGEGSRWEKGDRPDRFERGTPPPDLPPPSSDKPVFTEGANGSDFLAISAKDAAFLMGPSGKTKRKIAYVSGAEIDLSSNILEIRGGNDERGKAKKYVTLVMAQRVGPVRLDDATQHDDLTVMEVPADAVSFVTGKGGSFLRMVEEEFGTLLFFIDFDKANRRDQFERLAIFGKLRERRGAELKVMAAIEIKQPGYFVKNNEKYPSISNEEGFSTDRVPIDDEDYSYALGKAGATRKKIARASGCVVEYVGRLAYLSGIKKERVRAREYLSWLFQQRVGTVDVDYSKRDDVTVLQVPKDCVGFVTGPKGSSLRSVEDIAGAFCFIEGGRDDPNRDPKPLLIFGSEESRRIAEEMFNAKINKKQAEGWVNEESQQGGGHYGYDGWEKAEGKGEKSGGKGKRQYEKGKNGKGSWKAGGGGGGVAAEDERTGRNGYVATSNGDAAGHGSSEAPEPEVPASAPVPAAAAPVAAASPPAQPANEDEEEEEGGWGDWGGDDEDDDHGEAVATTAPTQAPASVPIHHPPQGYALAAGASAPTGSLRPNGEDVELPPQLLHEEAWPELGDMGAKKKGRR